MTECRVVPFDELLSKLRFFYKEDLYLNKKQETIGLCLIQSGVIFLMEVHMNANALVEFLRHSKLDHKLLAETQRGGGNSVCLTEIARQSSEHNIRKIES